MKHMNKTLEIRLFEVIFNSSKIKVQAIFCLKLMGHLKQLCFLAVIYYNECTAKTRQGDTATI